MNYEPSSLHTASDEELMRAFYQGSQLAFDFLAERWVAPLFRGMRLAGWPPQDAEDLTQEILLQVCRTKLSGHHYEGEKGRFAAWIRRIALNTSWEAARKRNQRPSNLPHPESVREPAHRLSPEDIELLDTAITLQILSTEEKTFLREWKEGLSQKEIAQQMGLAESTLSEMKQRSLEKIRGWLRQQGILP